jgi:predicted transcriptional regulator
LEKRHSQQPNSAKIIIQSVEIAKSYLIYNPILASEITQLIYTVYEAIVAAETKSVERKATNIEPAVETNRSIHPEFIICLEDGLRFKSLRRHLSAKYGLTPAEYRKRWGLPDNYPMVAPNYAAVRSKIAQQTGFKRKAKR